MVWSSAALTAAEILGFDNDKPMLVVQQASTPTGAHWTTTGAYGGPDVTLSSEPAVRAYDSIGSLVTSTTGVASTSPKYFNFYFTTSITIDSLLILGHNFNSIGITSVSLDIADNQDFDEKVREIAKYEIDGTTDNRILITNLNDDSTTTSKVGSSTTSGDATVGMATSGIRVGDLITGVGIQRDRKSVV